MYGIRQASHALYDACLRIVELANQLEQMPGLADAIGHELKLKVITTRMCAQQALDAARVNW